MLRKPGLDKTCESLHSYPKGYRGRPVARMWAETVTDLFSKNPNERHSQGSTRPATEMTTVKKFWQMLVATVVS